MRFAARALVATAAAVALIATGCGSDDNDEDDALSSGTTTTAGDATEQTVEIDMVDNAFEPATVDVEAGETVRFMFTNTGAVEHDAFIGDAAAQADHEEEMRAADEEGGEDMDMGSETTDMGGDESEMGSDEEEHGITVAPGETGELTHTFDEPGTLEIGCHEPGHYDAGMKVTVTVS